MLYRNMTHRVWAFGVIICISMLTLICVSYGPRLCSESNEEDRICVAYKKVEGIHWCPVNFYFRKLLSVFHYKLFLCVPCDESEISDGNTRICSYCDVENGLRWKIVSNCANFFSTLKDCKTNPNNINIRGMMYECVMP